MVLERVYAGSSDLAKSSRSTRGEGHGWVKGGKAAALSDSAVQRSQMNSYSVKTNLIPFQEYLKKRGPLHLPRRRTAGAAFRCMAQHSDARQKTQKYSKSFEGKKGMHNSGKGAQGKQTLHDRKYQRKRKDRAQYQSTTGTFFSAKSLDECRVIEPMHAALQSIGIERPSHIQAMSLRAHHNYEGRNLLIADHAGSGKTLAYLIPIIQQLWTDEQTSGCRLTEPNNPRVVILAPTAELVAQVTSVCRSLSATVPFRSVAITGGKRWRTQKDFLDEGVDVVVSTPERLLSHIKAGNLGLNKCKTMVMDEIDVLLGESFGFRDDIIEIITSTRAGTQFALVTATVPEAIFLDIQSLFSNITLVMGPALHKSAPGVTEQLVDCSGGEDVSEESGQRRKMAALLSLLQNHPVDRTLVFCNKIETCRQVENFLRRNDKKEEKYCVFPFHSAIDVDFRQRLMKKFMKPIDRAKLKDEKRIVLVCTDRASRGLDTTYVRHVILFDFPRDPSEYVRRIGRTARGASGEGLASVLVLGRQVRLAQKIADQNQKGIPIHEVPNPRD